MTVVRVPIPSKLELALNILDGFQLLFREFDVNRMDVFYCTLRVT
jgi:hypothetical protein